MREMDNKQVECEMYLYEAADRPDEYEACDEEYYDGPWLVPEHGPIWCQTMDEMRSYRDGCSPYFAKRRCPRWTISFLDPAIQKVLETIPQSWNYEWERAYQRAEETDDFFLEQEAGLILTGSTIWVGRLTDDEFQKVEQALMFSGQNAIASRHADHTLTLIGLRYRAGTAESFCVPLVYWRGEYLMTIEGAEAATRWWEEQRQRFHDWIQRKQRALDKVDLSKKAEL